MNGFVHQVTQPQKPIASRLGSLDIELTERDCIHCCIHLPVKDRAAKAREMTTDRVKAILKEAADLGCLRVRYTAGEPLLRPNFEKLCLYARRLRSKVLPSSEEEEHEERRQAFFGGSIKIVNQQMRDALVFL